MAAIYVRTDHFLQLCTGQAQNSTHNAYTESNTRSSYPHTPEATGRCFLHQRRLCDLATKASDLLELPAFFHALYTPFFLPFYFFFTRSAFFSFPPTHTYFTSLCTKSNGSCTAYAMYSPLRRNESDLQIASKYKASKPLLQSRLCSETCSFFVGFADACTLFKRCATAQFKTKKRLPFEVRAKKIRRGFLPNLARDQR